MKAASAKNIRHAGIFLTLSALVTAPFDELLIIEMGPMTMRLAQLLIMAASAVLLWVWFAEKKVLLPYGWLELSLLLLLNFAFCFVTQSESLVFQLGYQVWFALDIALVVLCVNFFRTQEERNLLLKTYIFVFALMAAVCIFQIFVGLFGVSFYTDQAFGDLPRADAFLSEPSYYACFALPGWVFLSFLLENGIEPVFTGRWLRAIWCAVTVSLIFSTSRMGILMMLAWLGWRVLWNLIVWKRWAKTWKALLFEIVGIALSFALLQAVYALVNVSAVPQFGVDVGNHADIELPPDLPNDALELWEEELAADAPKLLERILNFSGSDAPRVAGMFATVVSFWNDHIWIGSSLGGVYAEVMRIAPDGVWQVSNLLAELLVAFGLPGFLVLVIYVVRLLRASYAAGRYAVPMALMWGLLWQLGILQFNNNGLRIYLWVNIAVLSCCLPTRDLFRGKE